MKWLPSCSVSRYSQILMAGAAPSLSSPLSFSTAPRHNLQSQLSLSKTSFCNFLYLKRGLSLYSPFLTRHPKTGFFYRRKGTKPNSILSPNSLKTAEYEFSDGGAELELRLPLSGQTVHSSRDLFVDVHESSLTIRVQATGSFTTLMEIANLYGTIKPSETIWYIDEDQLVVDLKKHDSDLKWPDIMENWESLSTGAITLLKGTSVYIVGDSTDINHEVAKELSVGLKYTPLSTSELLETYVQRTIDSWVIREGPDSVAEAESAVLESLSSHVRAVVATLGGKQGAARGHDKWRHLHAGFTVWLSRSQALDEASAKDEALREKQEGSQAYSNADVVVKLGGWEPEHARLAAQACLSALKQLILTDKKLPGKKSLYIRLGCRGDWPNIKPPGWDPSSGEDHQSLAQQVV